MSLQKSFTSKVEKRLGDVLSRLPDPIVRKLAGPPLEIDGRILEPRIQLAAAAAKRKPSIHTVGVENARRGANASLAGGNAPRARGVHVADTTTPEGLPVRVYRAGGAVVRRTGLVPGMLFFHQGGFVVGDLDTCDSFCTRVASQLGIVVVSLDYRLAPEHKFPAQIDDAEAAWAWLQREGDSIGIDSSRVIVAGDSAGGHLSALLSQRLRDRREVLPMIQLLIYPFVDGTADAGSMESCAKSYPLDHDTMEWFGAQYLTEELDPSSAAFSPALAELSGLPPAIVVTAGFDPLRDQGIAYAEALRAAGVKVIDRCEDSLSHSFLSMDGVVPEAKAANRRIINDVRSLL